MSILCYNSKGRPLVALLMCLCPDDVRVEVEGELIHQGMRSSVVLSIIGDEGRGSKFRLESRIHTHSEEFRIRHIIVDGSTMPTCLTFTWAGWLSSCLEISLGRCGASGKDDVRNAVANLLTAVVTSLDGSDSYGSAKNCRLPENGLRTLLGPDYEVKVRNQIKVVLAEPSESNSMDLVSSYNKLKATIASVIPSNACTCNHCSSMDHQWHDVSQPKGNTLVGKAWEVCRVAQLWRDIGDIIEQGIPSLFVKAVGNPATIHVSKALHSRSMRHDHQVGRAIAVCVSNRTSAEVHPRALGLNYPSMPYLHHSILSIVKPWPFSSLAHGDVTSSICRCSGGATMFPMTLQYPRITNPWTVEYLLVDGRLYSDSSWYSAIVCADPKSPKSKILKRPQAMKSLLRQNSPIVPSGLGEHRSFTLTLRPEYFNAEQVLLLRSVIQLSTKSHHVNFLDIHLGFLSLSPASACEHYLRRPLEAKLADKVITTSVEAPSAKSNLAVTLTHTDMESQFLCCTIGVPALYQGDCCLTCAVEQAHEIKRAMIIGGSSP